MEEINEPQNVTKRLLALVPDHQEIPLLLLGLRDGSYVWTGGDNRALSIACNDVQFARVSWNRAGSIKEVLLSSEDLKALDSAEFKFNAQPIRKITRTTLYSHRPMMGFATIPGWLQLRPIPSQIDDRTGMHHHQGTGFYPFGVEIEVVTNSLPLIEGYRTSQAIEAANSLLATFLNVPIFQPRGTFAHVVIDGRMSLVRLTAPSIECDDDEAFSNVEGLEKLPIISREQYFDIAPAGAALSVPDLASLYQEYLSLPIQDQRRFVRAGANLFDAGDPTAPIGTRIVSAVTAIESLIENDGSTCGVCGSHIGITGGFRAFVKEHLGRYEKLEKLFSRLYPHRSRHVHGVWHADIDESLFALLPEEASSNHMLAWFAAKAGLLSWLSAKATDRGTSAALS